MGIDSGVIRKKGAWLDFKGETLGQGLEKVAELLRTNPELAAEIRSAALAASSDDEPVETGETLDETLPGTDDEETFALELDAGDEEKEDKKAG